MESPFEISPEAFDRALKSFEEIAVVNDCSVEPEDADWDGFCDLDVDEGQPDEYTEWQDVYGGDDWDHGQYDEY